jgi:hypothetical protein
MKQYWIIRHAAIWSAHTYTHIHTRLTHAHVTHTGHTHTDTRLTRTHTHVILETTWKISNCEAVYHCFVRCRKFWNFKFELWRYSLTLLDIQYTIGFVSRRPFDCNNKKLRRYSLLRVIDEILIFGKKFTKIRFISQWRWQFDNS